MSQLKIGFFGNFYEAFLDLTKDYNIKFVIFEKNKENNKIIQYCNLNNIRYFSVKNKEDIKKVITKFNDIDLFVVASFGIIFDKFILDFPKISALNIHPGILPKYRGRHPLPQAILNKEKFMGITAHIMTLEIDKGKVVNMTKLKINYDESYEYNAKLLLKSLKSFVKEAINNLLKEKYLPIDEKNSNYYSPLPKEKLELICNSKQLKELHIENSN